MSAKIVVASRFMMMRSLVRPRSRWGPGGTPQSTAIFLYFLGPEGFTYEYSFGVRRIEDDAAWVPRVFDPAEPGSIDMWLGPTRRGFFAGPADGIPGRPGIGMATGTARERPSRPETVGGNVS